MLDLKYRSDIQQFRGGIDLVALTPTLGRDVPMLDFSHTEELIVHGYRTALAELPAALAAGAGAGE
jgi:hypothetical protein